VVICAKTAEPTEMPFGLWARIGPKNRVRLLRDVAMTTDFWLSMGYSFGCVIVSDTLFDSRWGFWGQAIR